MRAGVRGRKRGAWAARGSGAARGSEGARGGEGERERGRAAGGATGRRALRGYRGRTETPLQNSQRVLLAKPRTAAVRGVGVCAAARRRPSSEGRGRENCAGVMAVGRDVPIAPPG